MKPVFFFVFALYCVLEVSSMTYEDAKLQEQINCEHWPHVFSYCKERQEIAVNPTVKTDEVTE